MIRTIIIDDEPSALSVLKNLLRMFCNADVELLATTTSPVEGKQLIEQHQPDLVFLDIEMPGMTGIDLVRSFSNPTFRVVFVTAYDAYAVEAFRLSAVDYLLKPIGEEDVVSVIEKIKNDAKKEQNPLTAQLEQLNRFLSNRSQGIDHKIAIAMSDKIVFISFADIIYCEANSNYTHLHLTGGHKLVSSKTLGEFETQLSNNNFLRIHHHYLINLNRVKEFQRNDGGFVIMEDSKELIVSQRKRKDFLDAIQHMII
jgi:two-component system, LytTR family, response regulator